MLKLPTRHFHIFFQGCLMILRELLKSPALVGENTQVINELSWAKRGWCLLEKSVWEMKGPGLVWEKKPWIWRKLWFWLILFFCTMTQEGFMIWIECSRMIHIFVQCWKRSLFNVYIKCKVPIPGFDFAHFECMGSGSWKTPQRNVSSKLSIFLPPTDTGHLVVWMEFPCDFFMNLNHSDQSHRNLFLFGMVAERRVCLFRGTLHSDRFWFKMLPWNQLTDCSNETPFENLSSEETSHLLSVDEKTKSHPPNRSNFWPRRMIVQCQAPRPLEDELRMSPTMVSDCQPLDRHKRACCVGIRLLFA